MSAGSSFTAARRGANRGVIAVKVGGSTLGEGDSTTPDLVELWRSGLHAVVVHGGGKVISDWVRKQGIQPMFVRGLRKTDRPTLEVAVAVLCGLVNTEIIACGGKAVGISGVSGSLFRADLLDPELGLVRSIKAVDTSYVQQAVDAGLIPVISPCALNLNPQGADDAVLSINADTAAEHLARALQCERLVFQTDVEGVLDATRRLIPRMTRRQARDLIESGVASGGMIPKIEACADALETVGSGHIIDGRIAGALLRCISGEDVERESYDANGVLRSGRRGGHRGYAEG